MRYTIVYCPELKLTGDRNYRVFNQDGNWLIDPKFGRAAFTLEQASDFLYRLAIKQVMEDYLKGEQINQ